MAAKSANRPATQKPKRKAPSTAWKKGQSGNPAGAPKRGMSWREIIDEVGEDIKRGGKYKGINYKHAVVAAMFEEASNQANTNAANWLARYGGGETEFSKYSDEQLRNLIAQRLGIDADGTRPGADTHGEDGD